MAVRQEAELRGYQRRTVSYIKREKRCMLAIDMGLGKTVSALTAIRDLVFDVRRTLVVAPKAVALNVWCQEIQQWAHLNQLRVTQLCGLSPEQRAKACREDTEIHVINRDNLVWLLKELGPGHKYDMVVLDESSSYKSASSGRFKAALSFSVHAEYLVLMTGTPVPNGLIDLWAQMFLIDHGTRLGRTKGAFERTFYQRKWDGNGIELKKGMDKAIHRRVKDKMLRLSKEEYLQLPAIMYNYRELELPKKAEKQYNELKNEFLLVTEDGRYIEAPAAATVLNKLLQLCNGNVYYTDPDTLQRDTINIHDAKIEALLEIKEEAGDNLLVAYQYQSDLADIQRAFPDAVEIRTPGAVEAWNRGEISMLLAHPASAGHGLNLQHGGHTIVWYGLNWSMELYEQFNARLHRSGQGHPVVVHHIVMQDTAEGLVRQRLAGKLKTQRKLFDAVRASFTKSTGDP